MTDPSLPKSADRFQRTPGRLEGWKAGMLPEGYSAAGVELKCAMCAGG